MLYSGRESYVVLSTFSWDTSFTIGHLKRQLLVGLVQQVQLRHVNFEILHGRALDWFEWLVEYSMHEDFTQCGYAAREFDHLLAESLASRHDSLNGL